MRRLAAILGLALATAGCSVDVEGAACATPGDRAACPDGQACGTDLTCSKRAAGCTPCTLDERTCQAGKPSQVFKCTAGKEPACGQITVDETCGVAHFCSAAAGSAACQACPAVVVDPGGAQVGTACRFEAVNDALDAAKVLGQTEVLLGGATGQVYGDVAPDRDGIVIPDGMTLRGEDSPLAPSNRPLLVFGGGEGVRLGTGSALGGVTVRRAASGPSTGIRLTGASPASAPSLDTVTIDAAGAGGAFGIGVAVEGSGAVTVAGAAVHGTSAAGLEVVRADGEQTVSFAGGLLQGNAIGVRLQRGSLTLDGTAIFSSTSQGILAAPATGDAARLTVKNGTVARGGSVGLELQNLAALDLEQVQVCNNAGRSQTVAGVNRTAGGLLALGNVATPAVLKANRFFGNTGDQVVIGGSATPWSLDAPSCDGSGAAAPNVLASYLAPGVGLSAIGASVSATNVSWTSNRLPADGTDYLRGASGLVTIALSAYCAAPAAAPICPAAP